MTEQKKQSKLNEFVHSLAFLDSFSVSPVFYHQGNQSYSTIFGGCCSLILCIVCLTIACTQSVYWSSDLQFITMSEENAGFNLSLTTANYPVEFRFVDMNMNPLPMKNNLTVNFICRWQSSTGTNVDISYGASTNCVYGEFCIPSNFTCDLYTLKNTEQQYMLIQASNCDPNVVANCTLYNYLQAGNSSSVYLYYTNQIPLKDVPQFSVIQKFEQPIYLKLISTATYWYNLTLYKQSYTTNNWFWNTIGVLYQSASAYTHNGIYQIYSVTVNSPPPRVQQLMSLVVKSDNKVQTIQQTFVDINGILSYFFSLYGTIIVFVGFVFGTYVNNIVNINIARYMRYGIDTNRKLIDFSESNIKTFLSAMLYNFAYDCYPQRLKNFMKPYVAMIEFGAEQQSLDNLFSAVIKLNDLNNNEPNPIVKLKINEEEINEYNNDVQDLTEAETEELRIYVEKIIKRTEVGDHDIQVFLEWVNTNHYRLEEAKVMADRLFSHQELKNKVYENNLRMEYDQFKDSMAVQKEEIFVENCQENLMIIPDTSDIKLHVNNDSNIRLKQEKGQRIQKLALEVTNKEQKTQAYQSI